MKRAELERMSVDDLWTLHEEISSALSAKIITEKSVLEDRLRQLDGKLRSERQTSERRPYPTVIPKFRNPEEPSQTWAGRGKQPRWLTAQLRSGKRIDDFKIQSAAG
jgi:DNA-binding protein H-NS